jgi:uncharacterized membrane protein YedE/YeeE
MTSDFTPLSGFIGGALIGLAAVLLLIANGRIAGVSGIIGGLLARVPGDTGWRVAFVLGLWLGALVYCAVRGEALPIELEPMLPIAIAAGLLVVILHARPLAMNLEIGRDVAREVEAEARAAALRQVDEIEVGVVPEQIEFRSERH